MGKKIVAADEGGHSLVEKARKMFFHALRDIIRTPCMGRIGFQAVLTHGMKKSGVAYLHDVGSQSTAQIADLLMAKFFQSGYSHFHAFIVVDSNIGHVGIG